jgi:hypothetical protein
MIAIFMRASGAAVDPNYFKLKIVSRQVAAYFPSPLVGEEKREWLPSPLVGEGAEAKRRRERGSREHCACGYPSPVAELRSAPPSPTRGEGKK